MLCQGCLSGDAAAPEEGGEACPVPAALPVSSSGCFVCSALLSIKGGDGSGFPRAAGTEQMSPGRARDDAGVAQHTVSALERSGRTELGTGRVLSHPQGTQRMGLLQTHRPKNTGTAGERHGGITPTSGVSPASWVSPQQGDHPNIPGVIPTRGSPQHPGCYQHPRESPASQVSSQQRDHPGIRGVTTIPGCHHSDRITPTSPGVITASGLSQQRNHPNIPECHPCRGITPISRVSSLQGDHRSILGVIPAWKSTQGDHPRCHPTMGLRGSPQHPGVSPQQENDPKGVTPTSWGAIPAWESPQHPRLSSHHLPARGSCQGNHPNILSVIPAKESPQHSGCHPSKGITPASKVSSQQGNHPNTPGCHPWKEITPTRGSPQPPGCHPRIQQSSPTPSSQAGGG